MRALKGLVPIAVSRGLILAVTAILWRLTLTTESSRALVYIYLFPVALIAALYNGRLALLSAAIALICADYFLQEPLYSLANDDPREYGDLLFSPFWLSRRSSLSEYWYDLAHCWGPNHVRL
jgi:K+-sensing histidine kinase KdpD